MQKTTTVCAISCIIKCIQLINMNYVNYAHISVLFYYYITV